MTPLSGPLFIALGVLLVAGAAKVVRPSPTATALEALRVPGPLVAARAMGVGEVVVAVAAATLGSPALFAIVAAAYAAFTVFILWALNGNESVGSCGCFGHEDTPPTPGHAGFNAAASAVAGLAIFDPVKISDFDGTFAEGVLAVVLVAVAVWLVVAALTSLPRVLALVNGTAAPKVPLFTMAETTSHESSTRGSS